MSKTIKEINKLNPFPATAVARLAKSSKELLTIDTPAFNIIRFQVYDYLFGKDKAGKTICVVGEYGTGKTHLLLEIIKFIDEANDNKLHAFYLDAPSDNFLELYKKRFIPHLKPAEIIERLDEYFADVVAEELKEDRIYNELSNKLKRREINPYDVIEKVGLMESKLQRQFQQSLKNITEDPCFYTALTLFHDPEFEEAIWAWFSGEEPEDVIKERGITKAINDDAIALEAIGVMAFLFGHQGHRFILLVDELEKVFSSSSSHFPNESSILAFKKLFEAIGNTKALLVLSGLPEFYESLPQDARERISLKVEPSPITGEDVIKYIRKANEKTLGKKILDPFSSDIAKFISIISGGNARKVVRICHHAWEIAVLEDRKVTRLDVKEILRSQIEGSQKEDICSEISQIIDRRGWLFEIDKEFQNGQRADFWMPVGEEGVGIAITLEQNVFSKEDLNTLFGRAKILKMDDDKGFKVVSLLIIGGYIDESLKGELSEIFNRIIYYKPQYFKDDFDSLLTGYRIKLAERSKENDYQMIINMLGQLIRQYRSLENIIRNELPRKEDITASIQYGLSIQARSFNVSDNSMNASSGRLRSIFYPIMSSLNDLKDIFRRPFFDKGIINETLSGGLLFKAIMTNKDVFESFYLTFDMVEFYDYYLNSNQNQYQSPSTEKFIKFMAERSNPYILSKFKDIKIYPNIMKDLGVESLMSTIPQNFSDLVMELSYKIKTLPSNLIEDYYKSRNGQTEDAYSNLNNNLRLVNTIIGKYPEINDIFVKYNNKLFSMDKKLKDILVIVMLNDDKSFIIDLNIYFKILSDFFFVKNMTLIFMSIITYYTSYDFESSSENNYFLSEVCYRFDRHIMSRYDKESFLKQFCYTTRSDNLQDDLANLIEEAKLQLSDFQCSLENLCKDTSRAIDKTIIRKR